MSASALRARAGEPKAPLLVVHGDKALSQCRSLAEARRALAGTVPITGFRLVKAVRSAPDFQTAVRVGCDGRRLLIHAFLDEPLLKSEAQQEHEVRGDATKTDGGAIRDDSLCLLFRNPDRPDEVFEITASAGGAMDDARCRIDDLWESRDLAWSSDAVVQAAKGDGHWELFMAVPLEKLNLRATSKTEVSLVRIARGRNELWSWNQVGAPHAPNEWGALELRNGGGPSPAKEPGWLVLLHPASEEAGGGLSAKSGVSLGQIPGWLEEAGRDSAHYRYAIADPVTARVIYRSPLYQTGHAPGSTITVKVLSGEVSLIDGRQEPPQAAPAEIAFKAKPGVGKFELKAGAGPATISIERGSPPERTTLEIPGGTLWSGFAADRWTRLWPGRGDTLYLAEAIPQSIPLIVGNPPAEAGEGWSLQVEIPDFCDLVAVSGYYADTVPDKPVYRLSPPVEPREDGRKLVRIVADRPVAARKAKTPTEQIVELVVVCRKPADPAKPARLRYWTGYARPALFEIPQAINLEVVPNRKAAAPKRFMIQLWGTRIGNMDNAEARRLLIRGAAFAGVNQIVSPNAAIAGDLDETGIAGVLNVNFEPWSINMAPYLSNHPETALVDAKGDPSKRLVCPQALCKPQAVEFIARRLGELIKLKHADLLQYDFEFNLMTGPHACYCDRCLAAFGGGGSISELAGGAVTAWNQFSLERNAKVLASVRKAAHENGVKLSVYSGYQSEATKMRYGIDWEKVALFEGADLAGCGFGRKPELLEATRAALGSIPLFCGEVIRPYLTAENLKNPHEVMPLQPAVLLQRALDSRIGIMLYERLSLDGRSWAALAAVSRLIGENEALFLSGELRKEGDWLVLHRGEDRLQLLLNQQKNAIAYTLPPHAGGEIVRLHPDSAQSPEPDDNREATRLLPPGGFVAIRHGGPASPANAAP